MKKIIYLFTVLNFLWGAKIYSQPAFSLVDANKMVLDPAFTGVDTSFKNEASIYTKVLLNNTAGKLNNTSSNIYDNNYTIGTYQMRLDKIHSGIGIMLNYTNVNATSNQSAATLYYRYTILPGLSVGADAGLVKLEAGYQYGGIIYIPYTKGTINGLAFDGGLGVLYQLKSVYAGFSVDHITSPEATTPDYNPENESERTQIPMINYSGISYNWIIGGHIGNKNEGIDLSASYRDFNLNMNISFILRHVFFGFSTLVGNYYNNNMPDIYDKDNVYFALMAGIKAYHNKIKVSFAYSFIGETNISPSPVEGGISYSF